MSPRLPQSLTRLNIVNRTPRASGCNCRGDGDAHRCPKWVCFASTLASVSRARLSCFPRRAPYAHVSACHDDDNSNAMQVTAAVTAHASSSTPRLQGLPLHLQQGRRKRESETRGGRQTGQTGGSVPDQLKNDRCGHTLACHFHVHGGATSTLVTHPFLLHFALFCSHTRALILLHTRSLAL